MSGNVIGCADVSSVPVAASQRARCQHPAAAAPLSLCGTPRRLQDSNTAGQYQLSPSLPPTPPFPLVPSFLRATLPASSVTSPYPLLCVCVCVSFFPPSSLHPRLFYTPAPPSSLPPPHKPATPLRPPYAPDRQESVALLVEVSTHAIVVPATSAKRVTDTHTHTHTHTHSHTPATQCHPASPLRQSSQRQCRSSSSAPLNNSGRGTVAACAALSVSRSRAETTCVTD